VYGKDKSRVYSTLAYKIVPASLRVVALYISPYFWG